MTNDQSLRVLIVDDNRDGADALGLLLEELDNEVHVTYGGVQALDVATAFRPDLMLVDLLMPGMDGCTLVTRFRQIPGFAHIKMVASTAQKAKWVGPFTDKVYLGDDCRNVDGTINREKCKPLDCFASYKVAVNDFISVGGSGFVVLKRNTTRFNTGISLRDALADFIRTLGTEDRYRCKEPAKWSNIKGRGPTGDYDYSSVTCLLPEVFAHDGLIQPLVR